MGCFCRGYANESLFFHSSDLSFGTQGRSVSSSLSCVLCRNPFGAKGIVVASKGFLGILVILLEIREGWGFRFGFLGGVFHGRREDLSLEELLFLQRNLPELLPGSLDSGVSNEVVLFCGVSRGLSSEFKGVVGRSGRMEGSDRDYLYFFSENRNTKV